MVAVHERRRRVRHVVGGGFILSFEGLGKTGKAEKADEDAKEHEHEHDGADDVERKIGVQPFYLFLHSVIRWSGYPESP